MLPWTSAVLGQEGGSTNGEHQELTDAGWSYRMNDRGWVIYRHPQTGRWYTRTDAMAIIKTTRIEQTPGVLKAASS